MSRGADDPNVVMVPLAVDLDLKLALGARIERLLGGHSATRQAEINEPNRNVANESGFQMTHISASPKTISAEPNANRSWLSAQDSDTDGAEVAQTVDFSQSPLPRLTKSVRSCREFLP